MTNIQWTKFEQKSIVTLFQRNDLKGELWCNNKNFSKERPTNIATNFPIFVTLSCKLGSTSAIEVD